MNREKRELLRQAMEVQFRHQLYSKPEFTFLPSIGIRDIFQAFGNDEVGFIGFAGEIVDHLLVELVSQRCDAQGLSLSTGEEGGSVSSGQHLSLTGDGPDIVQAAAVHTDLLRQNHSPHIGADEVVDDVVDCSLGVGKSLGERFFCLKHLVFIWFLKILCVFLKI